MGFLDSILGTDSSEIPSINGISADVTSVDDIINGKGNSGDYGRGVGAGIGAYFGQPQLGADIGSEVLPVLSDTLKNVWDSISK